MTPQIEIHGYVAPGFEPVRDQFARNFDDPGELGAGFALMRQGETLVDIYAGVADRKSGKAWTERTLAPVFSTGKAIVGLVMAWLVDQGRVRYDTRVSDVWPEFGAEGKDVLTLAQILSHQAGLSGIPFEMEASDWFDRELMEARLAGMAPLWPLSEGGSGYHPISYGVLADAVARRVDGQQRTIGAILRDVIAGPNGIDFHIGVGDEDQDRCAVHVLPPRAANLGEINTYTQIAFLKPWSSPGRRGAAVWRSAELPAANGHGTALSIAQLMGVYANEGQLAGSSLIRAETIAQTMREQVRGQDRVLPYDLALACGPMINRDSGFFGPEPTSVGHSGFGGSCGFADPVRGLSGAYVMNRQLDQLVGDVRARALINAAYDCL